MSDEVGRAIYPTFPMDYREFGLHPDQHVDDPGDGTGDKTSEPADDPAASDAEHADAEHPGDRPRKKVLIDAEDLRAMDDDAIAHPRELNRLRDEIARLRDELTDERASRAASASRQQALGAEAPPF